MVVPLYCTTYLYTTYSQPEVTKISYSNTPSQSHTSKLTKGAWHWFIYPIPWPHSKLLQWLIDIDLSISIAYVAELWAKYPNQAQLGSDMVALTGRSDRLLWQVALTGRFDRLLWQVALTGFSDRFFWQAHPALTSTSANFVWPTLTTYSTLDPRTLVVMNPGGRTPQIRY